MKQQINKIIAVIVTFNPDIERLYENFLVLRSQVAGVVIVDNSDDPFVATQTQSRFAEEGDCYYLNNSGNQGIAHALNRGLEYASKSGADWLLTMDQDSCLPKDYVAVLSSVISASDSRVVSIGTPFYSGERVFAERKSGGSVKLLITSGNLVQITAVQKVGNFREDFFIDYVDFDLSVRLRKAGFKLLESHETSFQHRLGLPEKRLFWKDVFQFKLFALTPILYEQKSHSFFRENFLYDPFLVLKCLRDMMKELVKILVGENAKGIKARAILKGIRDGIFGKMGKHSGIF